MVKGYSVLDAFSPKHFKKEWLETRRLKQPTRRHIPDDLIFINTAVNILIYEAILRKDVKI